MKKSLVFGGKCTELLANYDQESQSWRMLQMSFQWADPMLLGRLPKSGMTVNGQLYELQILEHRTTERVGSVLPTLTASDPIKHGTGGLHRRLVKNQTYSAGDHRAMLPTPTAHMHKENGYPAEYTRKTKTIAAIFKQEPTGQDPARVNPQFVEWMMGFPEDWTDIT